MKNTIIPLPFKFNLIYDFLRCGIVGWCFEIIFTSFKSLLKHEMKLMGQTSLWMFPIYGSAALFKPFFMLLHNKNFFFKGLIYAIGIFTGEFFSGYVLTLKNVCPWNYSNSRWNIKGLIRLDFLPCWFIAGIIFEHLLVSSKNHGINC